MEERKEDRLEVTIEMEGGSDGREKWKEIEMEKARESTV